LVKLKGKCTEKGSPDQRGTKRGDREEERSSSLGEEWAKHSLGPRDGRKEEIIQSEGGKESNLKEQNRGRTAKKGRLDRPG